MAEAAAGFARRGYEVEVLTTCAVDGYSWANELPEGASEQDGLVVRRFEAVRRPSRAALGAQLAIQAGRVPDLDHQASWLGFHFSCPGLFEHLLRHGRDYDAIVFAPYLFWNTTACMPLVAERAVFMPCLHDEAYARLDLVRKMFAVPALTWFLSAPEHHLAHRLGPVARPHSVTGAAVAKPQRYDPAGFRARYGLARPFILYAGRREADKGLAWLLQTLAEVFERTRAVRRPPGLEDLDLVVIGKGDPASPLQVPPQLAGRVVDLGFVSDAERDDAFAAAVAYVQPSSVESFSRTVMEAWLAGTPVLGLASNEVVAWHCRRSGGGLLFSGAASLAGALEKVACDPALRSELARAGRRYVLENYAWPGVLDRMEASLLAWAGTARRPGRPAGCSGQGLGLPAGGRGAGAVRLRGPEDDLPGGASPQAEADQLGGASAQAEEGEGGAGRAGGPDTEGTDVRRPGEGPLARRYLVAGSYPPVPGAAAAATLSAVRRAWDAGAEAVVASPRPSAARYLLVAAGSLGRQLRAIARREHCDGLVLCVEPGWPLRGTPGQRRRGASLLASALRRFRHVEVVVTGTPRDLGPDIDALAPVWQLASRVTACSPSLGPVLSAAVLAANPEAPPVEVVETASPPGVPPLEPGELLLATRARRAVGQLARQLLGRHEATLRAFVSKLARRP